jgi:uncharacterized membrane protein YfhO
VDIVAEAAEPSLVVVAQSYYHNWGAEIDGQPAPLLRANVAFQAVQIPAGQHTIHLFYQDRAFMIGAAVSICMLINCLFAGLLMAIRRLAAPPKPVLEPGDSLF